MHLITACEPERGVGIRSSSPGDQSERHVAPCDAIGLGAQACLWPPRSAARARLEDAARYGAMHRRRRARQIGAARAVTRHRFKATASLEHQRGYPPLQERRASRTTRCNTSAISSVEVRSRPISTSAASCSLRWRTSASLRSPSGLVEILAHCCPPGSLDGGGSRDADQIRIPRSRRSWRGIPRGTKAPATFLDTSKHDAARTELDGARGYTVDFTARIRRSARPDSAG